jgi:hypothetical protein
MQDEDARARVTRLPDLDEDRRRLVLGGTAERILLDGR